MRLNKKSTVRPFDKVSTRVIAEKRWLHRDRLTIGMYVNELDRPWIETSFLFQGFTIDTPEILIAVQESCEYAYVQTEKLA